MHGERWVHGDSEPKPSILLLLDVYFYIAMHGDLLFSLQATPLPLRTSVVFIQFSKIIKIATTSFKAKVNVELSIDICTNRVHIRYIIVLQSN